jgi:hypothetical protein
MTFLAKLAAGLNVRKKGIDVVGRKIEATWSFYDSVL